jgi:hypothetical protein
MILGRRKAAVARSLPVISKKPPVEGNSMAAGSYLISGRPAASPSQSAAILSTTTPSVAPTPRERGITHMHLRSEVIELMPSSALLHAHYATLRLRVVSPAAPPASPAGDVGGVMSGVEKYPRGRIERPPRSTPPRMAAIKAAVAMSL